MNDNCSGAVALGAFPACVNQLYSNVGATTSPVAAPSCFNGANAQRDVWFSFRTGAQLTEVTIVVNGRADGPNSRPLRNPQAAIYRGSCGSLSELACSTAPEGAAQVRLDARNLSPNTTYFLRVNDFSATAAANAGDFTVCVRSFVPDFIMGQTRSTSSCFGTLYDSGGPEGNYKRQENYSFTICPDQPFACLEFEMVNYETEDVDLLFGEDKLNFYAGQGTDGPLIASVYGVSDGTPFIIQSAGPCVTVQFVSDFFIELSGFELRWQCSTLPCDGSSVDNPTPITNLPYEVSGLSTCTGKATVGGSACPNDNFLAGPDYVFIYESPGKTCIDIQVTGARAGTGVAVFDGPPADPATRCVAIGAGGAIASASLKEPGAYYIVVAGDEGCTDFGLTVRTANCALSPALVDALRNPLNGCVTSDGLPSLFAFEDGFQDMDIRRDINAGCWLNVGDQPDFYWFSVQAQTEGLLGFILASADKPSDIDINVWGPFTEEQVVTDPNGVIRYIADNQPVRSTWSQGPEPTGLVSIHPLTRRAVTDTYDCQGTPGATGDDYVAAIQTKPGEVYVILVNDWGNEIQNGGISVDWSPATLGLLDPAEPVVIQGDTAICRGDSARIILDIGTNTIEWISGAETLSCTDCPNPVARPTRTTTYTAVVSSVCVSDTIDVTVEVFELSAGPDQTVCRFETIQIVAGTDFPNAIYNWTATPATGLEFSCTDCADPLITARQPGAYTVRVTLRPEEGDCQFADEMILRVLATPAPQYTISEREVDICEGDKVTIGVDVAETGLTYEWFVDTALVSRTATFEVSPAETTTYYALISNATCTVPSVDSVLVRVSRLPQIRVAADTLLCIGDTIQLGFGPREREVTYTWDGPEIVFDRDDPQTKAIPQTSGRYTLTAVRGACTVSESFEVNVNPADVEIFQGDTLFACLGTEYQLLASVRNPVDQVLVPVWTSSDPDFGTVQGDVITVSPTDSTVYYVQVSYLNCVQTDSILVVVDSLPPDLGIMPQDTSICEGQFVVFRTPAYETGDYPNIVFSWRPFEGQQSPDTLLNLVVTPDTTTTYYRITTNGGCRDSIAVDVEVKPIPVLSVTPSDTTICVGETIQLRLNGPPGLEKIMWEPMQSLTCFDCPNPFFQALAPGSVSYSVMAELNGCPGSAQAEVTVIGPAYDLTTQTRICRGQSVVLNTVSSPGAVYTWTSTDPAFGTVVDPRVVVSPTVTTTYFLRIETADCDPVEDEITIQVVNPPTVEATASANRICEGESVTLRSNVTGGVDGDTFAWYILNNPNVLSTQREVNVFPTATNRYVFEYYSLCGTFRDTVTVQVVPGIRNVTLTANPPGQAPEGSPVVLSAEILTNNPGLLTIVWQENGVVIPDSTGPQITVRPVKAPGQEGSTYTVTVATPEGCTATAQIFIPVLETVIVVPNAFTPNGDGQNDRFRILPSGEIDQIIRFQVYSRWGQLVYDNNDADEGWDGTFNGKPQASDVYVYVIVVRRLGGVEQTLRGEVALIR